MTAGKGALAWVCLGATPFGKPPLVDTMSTKFAALNGTSSWWGADTFDLPIS